MAGPLKNAGLWKNTVGKTSRKGNEVCPKHNIGQRLEEKVKSGGGAMQPYSEEAGPELSGRHHLLRAMALCERLSPLSHAPAGRKTRTIGTKAPGEGLQRQTLYRHKRPSDRQRHCRGSLTRNKYIVQAHQRHAATETCHPARRHCIQPQFSSSRPLEVVVMSLIPQDTDTASSGNGGNRLEKIDPVVPPSEIPGSLLLTAHYELVELF
ncbi:hypothetical protein BKA70DRAFT_1223019 [Coprinopsis sp. MPI-PUGE-AT-0042]|nr:hypothetical protein BKA70DRAFT_1223019 [Coprinopsis sp. MPI-PUGE-AT-0042]